MLKDSASGARLGPDQKGTPFELTLMSATRAEVTSPDGGESADLVLWKIKQELLDLVHIVELVLQAGPLDTLRKRSRALLDEVLVNLLQLAHVLTRRLERRLDVVGLREVQVDGRRRVDEQGVERFARPLVMSASSCPLRRIRPAGICEA